MVRAPLVFCQRCNPLEPEGIPPLLMECIPDSQGYLFVVHTIRFGMVHGVILGLGKCGWVWVIGGLCGGGECGGLGIVRGSVGEC